MQAETDCARWNADVAALSTIEEYDAVIASGVIPPEGLDVLLGGRDVTGMGDWLWLNGEPWVYVGGMPPWQPGEPVGGTYIETYYTGGLNADVDGSCCGWVCERTPAGFIPPP
jgi:hypothetical protein